MLNWTYKLLKIRLKGHFFLSREFQENIFEFYIVQMLSKCNSLHSNNTIYLWQIVLFLWKVKATMFPEVCYFPEINIDTISWTQLSHLQFLKIKSSLKAFNSKPDQPYTRTFKKRVLLI